MKRLKFTVLWLKDHWELRGIGTTVHAFKVDAVAEGRKLAKAAYQSGDYVAQLVIKGKNGRIQTEHTYGKDPRQFKG